MLLLDEGQTHDVFDVVDATDTVVRARSPYLFEVGEELRAAFGEDAEQANVVKLAGTMVLVVFLDRRSPHVAPAVISKRGKQCH